MGEPRRRDSARTRKLLLETARRRFARDGYAATTVRDIADEAGANVALISRYFGSKEGLFEACLAAAADSVRGTQDGDVALEGLGRSIARGMAGVSSAHGLPEVLLLSLRPSGDEQAERARIRTLSSYAERMAALALPEGAPLPDDLHLRGQVLLATALGVAVLRATPGLGPITSATEDQLADALSDVVSALLGRGPGPLTQP
ncbi:TetR/AcrR family transcriptional regulator [Motilibacter deserti]|uniref:TetR/AcrR family transcriptional regulator n=1 Tax=Motilibacter deserti TaxID=2714956 RepID=A0ABX0GZG2_9ACTN|nr:TetR/AcrR family transcriptional regulator [Motilibacter deserti]NHC15105.1 TetR/AcrR family transcriptional regulator [Motilibacter deserti]